MNPPEELRGGGVYNTLIRSSLPHDYLLSFRKEFSWEKDNLLVILMGQVGHLLQVTQAVVVEGTTQVAEKNKPLS